MPTTRSKMAAGAATLVTGAGLAAVLITGNAAATAPQPAPDSTSTGIVVTSSVPCGATALALEADAPEPTATVMASAPAAEQAATAHDPVASGSGGVCADTAPFQPGAAATAPATTAGR